MRRYVELILRYRGLVIGLALLMTAALASQLQHLRLIIDPAKTLPRDHPAIVTTERIEQVFGSKYVIVVGLTPKTGDGYQPSVLAKVSRITQALADLPGVVKSNLLSLAARRAKRIAGTAEGMEVRPLVETVPQTPAALAALRAAVADNPAYLNAVVSSDGRTMAVVAEFKEDPQGFRHIVDRVNDIVDRERDGSVDIAVGGLPVYLAHLELFSERMGLLFPLAVLLIGLIHWEAFRTFQGMILPLVTALLSVIWGLGIMGAFGVPMDPFNATTPILILAVAAGHAVQILKRYYEEFHRLWWIPAMPPKEANRAAVVEAIAKIGPAMLTAGLVAAAGFFSLLVFPISAIRNFGVFAGLGILSALCLEMTLIPAVRSLLPPPSEAEARVERARRPWDRLVEAIARGVTGAARPRLFAVAGLIVLVLGAGALRVPVDNSVKSNFAVDLPFQQDDRTLNARLGGTETLYLLVEGAQDDAITRPETLRKMDELQRLLAREPLVGKTLSLADFVRRMNRAMHGDDPAYDTIPESRELIAQYLLLYAMSGDPGDFDSYVDYRYRSANLWVFLKTDSSDYLDRLRAKLSQQLQGLSAEGVRVSVGGSVAEGAALNEVMVRGKLQNLAVFAAVIVLATAVAFRSIVAGLLVLVPLASVALVQFGVMGWAGVPLDITTAIILPMAVGIGADYAIYLIWRIREELATGNDEETAMREALTTAGKAVLFVATAIAGGYLVLLCSWGFYLHIWLGLFIATAMAVSCLGALTLVPSLILTLRPRFLFAGSRLRGAPVLCCGAVALGSLLSPGLGEAWGEESNVRSIMEKNYAVSRVADSTARATMTLINKTGQERVRKTFGTTKLQANGADNMRMVRFLSPADVQGTVTLLIEHSDTDDDMWIYLPALKKVRRLIASNKKDSFVGSDFSYGDIIGHKVEDWEHRLLREEVRDGHACFVVESVPRDDAVRGQTGYSRRVGWIRRDNFVTVEERYWDQGGHLLKTFTARDIRLVDDRHGKWQPMWMQVSNVQTGHRTLLQFEEFEANQGIGDEFFTRRYMERQS